jgi:protein gp37
MDVTIIAWTNATFNPAMGCTKVSDGCSRCYAERLTRDRMGLSVWGPGVRRQRTSAANWRKPHAWDREARTAGLSARVFCASLCDVFEAHPDIDALRPDLWELIRSTPHLDWQLLTKRPERIVECLPADWGAGWENVWLGTSIEDMRVADRADHLRKIPAVVRFVSYEPALGPLDELDLAGLQWVIVGGESGPTFRTMDLDWARAMRVRCREASVAYFFKQSSAYRTELGTTLDGDTVKEYPRELRRFGSGSLFARAPGA